LKRIMLKRLLLLAVMAAMVLALAIPALASSANTGSLQDVLGQGSEQEADSGEIEQSFEATGSGDNSNQCFGFDGTANTGNLQGSTSFSQFNSDVEQFEQDDVGSNLMISGDSPVTCDQQVNQAASAG
jgi:hypothetical protein